MLADLALVINLYVIMRCIEASQTGTFMVRLVGALACLAATFSVIVQIYRALGG